MIPLTLPAIIFSTYPKVDIAIFGQVLLKSDLCPVFNLVLGKKKKVNKKTYCLPIYLPYLFQECLQNHMYFFPM